MKKKESIGRGKVDTPTRAEIVAVRHCNKRQLRRQAPAFFNTFQLRLSPSLSDLIAQSWDIHDLDTGGQYTVKIYRREQTGTEDSWSHRSIRLEPDSMDFNFTDKQSRL